MTAIHCHQCARPNNASAKSCIWCSAQISDGAAVQAFETTIVDVDYLEGIERLDEPGPVRLVVSPEGIEVVEGHPGSRTIKIPARSILEATLTYSILPEKPADRPWWRSAIEQMHIALRHSSDTGVEASNYIVTIKYRDGDEVRTGVFSRSDGHGLMLSRRLAGVLAKLTGEPRIED